MPYVKKELRKQVDSKIEDLLQAMHDPSEGLLNYCLTRLVLLWLGTNCGYSDYNTAIGVVECVKLELYRRVLSQYEDGKRDENGEVYGRL